MVKTTKRRPLAASPDFLDRLKKIQGEIKAHNGLEPSLTDLTEEIIRTAAFEDVEKQLIEEDAKRTRFKFNTRIK